MTRNRQQRSPLRWLLMVILMAGAGTAGWFIFGDDAGHKAKAIELYVQGDFVAAGNHFERLISPGDPDPEVLYYAALCEIERKNYERGIGQYLSSLAAFDGWRSRAFYHAVSGRLRAGRVEEVRQMVERPSAGGGKTSALTQEAKGLYYFSLVNDIETQILDAIAQKLGDRRTRATYEGITRRILRATTAVYNRSLDGVLEKLRSTEQFDDTVPIQILFDRGHQTMINAAAAFEKAVATASEHRQEPDPVRSRYELSEIYRIRGQLAESNLMLRSLLELDKRHLKNDKYFENWHLNLRYAARRNLAEALIAKKNYREAVTILEDAEPDDEGHRPFEIEVMLAECHSGAGRPGKMIEIVDRWLQKDPSIFSMNYFKGRYYYDQGDYANAVIFLERSVARGRSQREYMETLARCYLKLGRFANASGLLEILVEIAPRDVDYILLRGEAMAGQDWQDDAIAYYIDVLRNTYPDRTSEANRTIRARLNSLMIERGLVPRDLFAAERLYALDPENFLVARRYIELLIEAKNWKLATTISREVLTSIRPSDADYHDVLVACGNLALALSEWSNAVVLFDRAAKARPFALTPYLGQAEALVQVGDFGAAWEAIAKAEALGDESERLQKLRFRLLETDREYAKAAKIGDQLVSRDPKNIELVQDVARVHLAAGSRDSAAKLLDRIKTVAFRDLTQAVEYGALLLRAEKTIEGERVLQRVAVDNPDSLDSALQVANVLLRFERFDAVIRVLLPATEANPEISGPALKLLARAYEEKGDYDAMLSTYSKLRFAGERNWVYDRVSEFCRSRGAFDEALSVVESAVAEQAATPGLLESSVLLALDMRDTKEALRWARQLRLHPDVSAAKSSQVEAHVRSQMNETTSALDLVAKALKDATPGEQKQLRREQIEILGRAGLVEQMSLVLQESYDTLSNSTGLAETATFYLTLNDHPDAMAWQNETLKRDGESVSSLMNRALLHFESDNPEAAEIDLRRAWELAPSSDSLHALGLVLESAGKSAQVDELVKSSRGLLSAAKRAEIELIRHLKKGVNESALLTALTLELGTTLEAENFGLLLKQGAARPETSELLIRELPRFFWFRRHEQGLRKAVKSLQRLREKMPQEQKTLDLLAARTYLQAEWGFGTGIRLVSKILAEEDYHETALQIYAENYVAARNDEALDKLMSMVLQLKNLSTGFYFDLARTLLNGGYPKTAARLLYACPDDSSRKNLMSAEAHYRSGQIEQAGLRVLKETQVPNDAVYLEIMAAYRARDPETLQEAYKLASDAVYRFASRSPSALLLLCDLAFRVGNTAEATKNVRRALAEDPASARTALSALEVLNRHAELAGLDLREWLDDRRNVLDPAQRVARLVNSLGR